MIICSGDDIFHNKKLVSGRGQSNGKRVQFTCGSKNVIYLKHVAIIHEVNEVGDTVHGLAYLLIPVLEAKVEEHVQIQEFPVCFLKLVTTEERSTHCNSQTVRVCVCVVCVCVCVCVCVSVSVSVSVSV